VLFRSEVEKKQEIAKAERKKRSQIATNDDDEETYSEHTKNKVSLSTSLCLA